MWKLLSICLLLFASCATTDFFGAQMASTPVTHQAENATIRCAFIKGWKFSKSKEKSCVCQIPPNSSWYNALGLEAVDFIFSEDDKICEKGSIR